MSGTLIDYPKPSIEFRKHTQADIPCRLFGPALIRMKPDGYEVLTLRYGGIA